MMVFLHNDDWSEHTMAWFDDRLIPGVGDDIDLTDKKGSQPGIPLGGRRWEVIKRSFSAVGDNAQRIDITMRETS